MKNYFFFIILFTALSLFLYNVRGEFESNKGYDMVFYESNFTLIIGENITDINLKHQTCDYDGINKNIIIEDLEKGFVCKFYGNLDLKALVLDNVTNMKVIDDCGIGYDMDKNIILLQQNSSKEKLSINLGYDLKKKVEHENPISKKIDTYFIYEQKCIPKIIAYKKGEE